MKKDRINLSVALATFNEESSLAGCLESVKNLAEEIVIVDGSSVDRTVEIAKSFGAKVIVTENKPIFHLNKQLAMDLCQGRWILQLDADERVTPKLFEEIKDIVQQELSELPSAYWIKRQKMFLGSWIKKGGQYPDPVIRLIQKGKAFLPCQSVHEQMTVKGETGWLKGSLIHLPTPSFTVYLTKDNRYSTLTAQEMMANRTPLNFFVFLKFFLWRPLGTFCSLFIRHRGFLDGFPGFVFAFYSGLHHFNAFVKYWEMVRTQRKEIKEDWV